LTASAAPIEPPFQADDAAVRDLWLAVVVQMIVDASAPDADLFTGRGTSTNANKPTPLDRASARGVMTLPEHGRWRRELCDLAGLSPGALDRAGLALQAHGWRMHEGIRRGLAEAADPVGRDIAVEGVRAERRGTVLRRARRQSMGPGRGPADGAPSPAG
jgi:hypothetical protein